jgi:hypothetical protein
MKRYIPLVFMVSAFLLIIVLTSLPTIGVKALPEYAAQVGEPCSTCHISPSGGGSRTPRGQAWVAASKPGAVPDLVTALEALGVSLETNLDDYTNTPEIIPPARPLQIKLDDAQELHDWLKSYAGN